MRALLPRGRCCRGCAPSRPASAARPAAQLRRAKSLARVADFGPRRACLRKLVTRSRPGALKRGASRHRIALLVRAPRSPPRRRCLLPPSSPRRAGHKSRSTAPTSTLRCRSRRCAHVDARGSVECGRRGIVWHPRPTVAAPPAGAVARACATKRRAQRFADYSSPSPPSAVLPGVRRAYKVTCHVQLGQRAVLMLLVQRCRVLAV